MDNFRRNNNKFGGRRNDRPSMHKAVCDECGKDCEVPFKPTGEKPIFCNDCFRNKGGNASVQQNNRDAGRRNSNDREMHKAVCDKCGKDCEVPFKPSSDKPIYCSECFNKGDNKSNVSGKDNKQFEMINAKLDKILEKLNPVEPAKPKKIVKSKEKKKVSPKKVTAKPKVKPKAKKKK